MKNNEIYTPEQLEAMKQPHKKKTHTFIDELFNTNSSFRPQNLSKGIAYINYIDNLDFTEIEDLVINYDQIILVFKRSEDMVKFVERDLSHSAKIQAFLDNSDFNETFKFIIKQIQYTHCIFSLYHEDIKRDVLINKNDLKSSIVYHLNGFNIYPTYIVRNLSFDHTINKFIKYYINEVCNFSIGVSHIRLEDSEESIHTIDISSFHEVIQALDTINAIYAQTKSSNLSLSYNDEANALIDSIKLYMAGLEADDREEIRNYIINHTNQFNFSRLNDGQAETLVIAYCFPPFIDTSGNVMAKRIRDKGEVVDIISNNMSRIRKKDMKLNSLSEHLIDVHYLLDAKQAFSSWESISGFTEKGLDVIYQNQKVYQNLYSRAMFPQSHFLAFEIKRSNPEIYWRAEFSDPLHSTVTSDLRYAPITDEIYLETVKQQIKPNLRELVDDNVFNVCELLALSHANELIFTNENQLEYMIERFDETIKNSIRERAVISRHPIPLKEDYRKVISNYQVSPDYVNLGYFGNFYATRGFNEIELVCKYLEIAGETNFKIHCFTNINGTVKRLYQASDFKEYIILHPLVGYFEFLNITTMFDGLLLFDAHTIGIKPLNPYIPSKLSDYKGSGRKVWAFTEENSIMDRDEDILRTRMSDYEHYIDNFKKIKGFASRFNL
ncbi:hypothetical protein [Staphylococcus canis]|uniref:DUF1002 domain-containing protein n=1 Tax=Staphylococcus canis TaxID=2724942 RepID=A0ABS0TBQ7_9STAP|nr:hypothetical protein [Staphylococcus canis]MBI5975396.1 DUF1002 domain-containing protein [Staphylococcus canis]